MPNKRQNSNYYKKSAKTDRGIQIDLLIDRNGKVINLWIRHKNNYSATCLLLGQREKKR
ncbi:MAG: hypothetical protein U5L45_05150 [Saprospiraceae bacterium]|nr:hypothetical protein [Saprospiraceae bacterium]